MLIQVNNIINRTRLHELNQARDTAKNVNHFISKTFVLTIRYCKLSRSVDPIEANNKLIKELEKGHDLFHIECSMDKFNKDFI